MLLVVPALAGISRAAWLTKCSTTTTFYHQCHLRWNRYYPHLLIVNIDDILCTNHFPIHQILPKFSGVPEEELKSDFNRKVARNNGLSNFPVELRLQFLPFFCQKDPSRCFKNQHFWKWDTTTMTNKFDLDLELFFEPGFT